MLSCLPLPFNCSIQHSECVYRKLHDRSPNVLWEWVILCCLQEVECCFGASGNPRELASLTPVSETWTGDRDSCAHGALLAAGQAPDHAGKNRAYNIFTFWEGGILALAAPVPDTYTFYEWQSGPELGCWMGKAVPTVWGLCFGWGWLLMWAEIMMCMVTKPSFKTREHHCLNCPDAPCGTAPTSRWLLFQDTTSCYLYCRKT